MQILSWLHPRLTVVVMLWLSACSIHSILAVEKLPHSLTFFHKILIVRECFPLHSRVSLMDYKRQRRDCTNLKPWLQSKSSVQYLYKCQTMSRLLHCCTAANFNLDFSLMKVEVLPEFNGLRDKLSPRRLQETEEGMTHIVARCLVALFELVIPPVPISPPRTECVYLR
jgi:hypothetical protein